MKKCKDDEIKKKDWLKVIGYEIKKKERIKAEGKPRAGKRWWSEKE